MTADEIAGLLADMPQEQLVRLAGGALATLPAPEGRPPNPRVKIWPKGSQEPVDIWIVDRPEWLKAGATLSPVVNKPGLATGERADSESAEASVAAGIETMDLGPLRRLWSERNPGKTFPPAAKERWFRKSLSG
jgi:hypothetical protein